MNKKPRTDVIESIERSYAWAAAVAVVVMFAAYWGVGALLKNEATWQILFQGLLVNFIAALATFVLAYLLLYRKIQKVRAEKELGEMAAAMAFRVDASLRKSLSDFQDIFPIGRFAWLYSGKQVLEAEDSIEKGEVWVVSPHLKNDTDMESLPPASEQYSTNQTAIRNLRRGIRYTFIVPSTEVIRGLIPIVRQKYENEGGLEFIELEPREFGALTISEIAIYNPRVVGSSPRRLFLELPVNEENAWWVEPTAELCGEMVERVRRIVDGRNQSGVSV